MTKPSSSPSTEGQCPARSFNEFVAMLALCMSLVALSIDTILPAMQDIGREFSVPGENTQQFIITALFAGLSLGQLIVGPLSDRLGRKVTIFYGLGLFVIGSLLCIVASDFNLFLAARFIQGMGAAAPRVLVIAIVRDRYEGRVMAKVISYVMGIFICLPAIAPTIGQAFLMVAPWRGIFVLLMAIAAVIFVWLFLRLDETLHEEDRRPFTLLSLWQGIKTVCTNRMTLCYMVSAGFIFGAFMGYLNSSQQIFQSYYDLGDKFPLYFGATAAAIGAAFFTNAQLVERYGMRAVIVTALIAMAIAGGIFGLYEIIVHGQVPLPAFMIYMLISAFCMGMLFGNFNALAMVPMGHIAGMASAVIGCVSLVIAAGFGALIGQMFDNSLTPVTAGFFGLSLASLVMMYFAEKGTENAS